jgi:hypothetical protein
MPFTEKQRKLFAIKYRNGELSKAKFDKMMSEGIRKDVDRNGHVRSKRKKKRSRKRSAKR